MGVAARISEIFLYKEYGKRTFFIKNPNLTKKKILAVGRGVGVGVARVSDLFLFSKESRSEKKLFSF